MGEETRLKRDIWEVSTHIHKLEAVLMFLKEEQKKRQADYDAWVRDTNDDGFEWDSDGNELTCGR